MEKIELTCGNCLWNDDLLCDKKGIIIRDDDKACDQWELKESNNNGR